MGLPFPLRAKITPRWQQGDRPSAVISSEAKRSREIWPLCHFERSDRRSRSREISLLSFRAEARSAVVEKSGPFVISSRAAEGCEVEKSLQPSSEAKRRSREIWPPVISSGATAGREVEKSLFMISENASNSCIWG